jgi:hypothetical protein
MLSWAQWCISVITATQEAHLLLLDGLFNLNFC